MTKSRPLAPIAFSVSVLAGLCSAPSLADEETTLNLYLNGGQYWFSGDRLDGSPFEGYDLEDTTGGGAGLGYSVTDRWALEGVLDYFSAKVEDLDEKVEVYNYHMDLFYHFAGRFCGNFCWQPYVAFGAGEIRVDNNDSYDDAFDWHDRQTMVNLGLGVKYKLGPRWQARGDARLFQGVEHGGLDGFVSISIGYQWYEYPRIVRDFDGDGVFDDIDGCPQTPPGIPVHSNGCPGDSDYDGVPDYLDRCPSTPAGTAVNENGCTTPI
ncbi:porin family protein [Microbulbifer hainanensis]|uniref:porin family protein n=1 Tax=Microbulbifer hainanensis TaxID=2735675 RepID=UPI001866CAAA|nr:porin family protein [Microbulbifer hainanensis]